jgi:alkanesulfonate monooxygenase SsuD/methylene tetrahydromethanopterin reductase-like flavin-dependent oxidoreductase (luciferase family)
VKGKMLMELSFGLQLEPQFGYTKDDVDQFANLIENSKFDTIWVSDHMFLDTESQGKSAFDALTLMTYLVTKYSQLRVGSLVLCNSYHHPALLAKKVTTLDHLSEGRIEIGYGAGWKEVEYKAYGIDFPSVKERLDMLEEGLDILLKLWSEEEKPSYSGKYYTITKALCFPKPYQKPHPNLWIGSMAGGNRMLRIAAQYGDGINLAWAFSPERCKTLFERLNKYCIKYNRDPSSVKRSLGFWVRIYEDEDEMEKGLIAEAEKRKISVEEYKTRVKGALVGTKEQVTQKLLEYKKVGITHYIFMVPYEQEMKYLNMFNDEILSNVV